ncbi:MAG TPA: VWA domain-containing protein [Thermoanaerobaculia bacterium]|nr:VWA domain-containing protein [Thermoanaerobaculia bacterium]
MNCQLFWCRAVLAIQLFFILSSFAAAQQAPAAEPPIFGEALDVRVVNVEVVVTGKDGNRVSGLKPEDFLLRVDGKEVPIEYFTEVKEGRSVAPAPAEGEPATEESGAVPGVGPEGVVPTWYLVFVDDYFPIAAHRNAVLKSLKDDLGRLGPNDRMAVVAWNGGRLSLVSNWSGSRRELEKAFDDAMARPARGFDRLKELRNFQSDEAFAATATDDGRVLDLAVLSSGFNERESAYADSLVRQVQAAVGATVSAMRGFAAPEGRKVLLLLSGGWPFSPQTYVRANIAPSRSLEDGDQLYRRLTDTANLLGYTIYPVDVPGIQREAAGATAEAPADLALFNLGEQEIEGTLEFIAKETGGKSLVNSNRAIALASASSDTRSYYWLGFSPDWQRNDKSHAMKVEVRRPGLQARSRAGFLDLSRKTEVSMKVESALLFGNLPGAVPLPMRLGAAQRSKKGTEVPITLGLPVDLMTVVPVDGKYAAQLELRFIASDSEGNSSEIPVIPISLSSDKPPTPGKMVKYETRILLRRGQADHLVVAVYDPLSGKMATAEAKLEEEKK